MRFLKNKILWLTVYAIGVTFVFLYLLFPSTLVLQQLEASAASAGFFLKAASLDPSLPLGIKLTDLTVGASDATSDVVFQGEALDLQASPAILFQKRKNIHFSGKSYSGSFDGSMGFPSLSPLNLPAKGKINFQNIDLARINPSRFPFLKGISGKVRGSTFFIQNDAASRYPLGKLSLYLSRGAYPLPEPFLGVKQIEFDRGEIQAQLKDGRVTLDKLELYGAQVNCFLNGSIMLAERLEESQLNLKGVLEIVGKNKIKMNVTVGGTLASPAFRYI
ncbi:MAG: type II secretion system protein GspN [Deltaproteobacteria bacterium]